MSMPSYLIVNYSELDAKLKELIKKLINLEKDENGNLFYYGNGSIECDHNREIIDNYIPIIKTKLIKGYANWNKMKNRNKYVASHLKLFCKVLCGKPVKSKCVRYPLFKSKMVNKFTLPITIK